MQNDYNVQKKANASNVILYEHLQKEKEDEISAKESVTIKILFSIDSCSWRQK